MFGVVLIHLTYGSLYIFENIDWELFERTSVTNF